VYKRQPYGYVKLANTYLYKKNQPALAIDNYLKAIEIKPTIPIAFYHRLVEALKQEGRLEETRHWINSVPQLKEEEAYLNIWKALNQTKPNKNIFDDSKELQLEKAKKYFMETSTTKVINLKNIKDNEKQFIENNGLSLNFVKLNKASLIDKNGVFQDEYIKDEEQEKTTQYHEIIKLHQKRAADFQQSMLRDGCVYAICPSTGKTLSSNVSFPMGNLAKIAKRNIQKMALGCYRFVGNEVFYLVANREEFQKDFLYFPRINLVVHLSDSQNYHVAHIHEIISFWKAYLVVNSQSIYSSIWSQTPKKILAVVGISENIGHHVWNDLSGIMVTLKAGNLDKVGKFLVNVPEFFGPIDEIFPEIPSDKIKRINTLETKDGTHQEILTDNYFALRLASNFVQEELAQRIYQVCLKKCSSNTIATIENAKKKHFPLIWINIRTNQRKWVSQAEGIANIIQQIATDYPDLGIVFDGVSLRGEGEQAPNYREKALIEGEKIVVEQILALIPKSVTIYNNVPCLMYDSIAWASAVDFYISAFSGGIAKVTWIANKPGILHTSHTFMNLPAPHRAGTGFDRENAVVATFIGDRYIADVNGTVDDYDLDWKIIHDEAVKMIASLLKPKSEDARKVAKELMQQKNYEGAVAAYQKAIALNTKQPAGVLIELGECLEKVGKVDEALSCYQQERHLHPYNPYGYVKLANTYLHKKNQAALAIDNYLKAIEIKPNIPFVFYQRLVEALKQEGRLEEAINWKNTITQRLQEEPYSTYENIWKTLNSIEPDERVLDCASEINPGLARQYFEITKKTKAINLGRLKESEREFLVNAGLKLDFLKLNQAVLINENGVSEEEFTANKELKAEVLPDETSWLPRCADFQQSLIANRSIYAVCPTTGKILKSDVCLSIMVPKTMRTGCYAFMGKEMFYLIADSVFFTKCSLYFPRIDCIVYLQNSEDINIVGGLFFDSNSISSFKVDLVTNFTNINSHAFKRKLSRKMVAIVGISENIGHHVWNDLSGIMETYNAGNLQKIDRFLVTGTEFFGDIDEIFPEIPSEKIQRIDTLEGKGGASKEILEHNYFALRLAGSCVQEELAKRIHQVCLKKCSLETIAKIEEAKNKLFPIIWINIRTHYRYWVSQIEGIANILNHLAVDYPNIGVVFDGVSLIGNEKRPLTQREEVWNKAEKVAIEQILALISEKNFPVYNNIGCMMYESIVWADAVDFYISAFTGGIAKVTWVANKPGILHTNKEWMKKPQVALPGTGFDRENAVVATFVPKNCIADIDGSGDPPIHNNYDLDWRVIYDESVKIISQLKRQLL